MKFIKTKFVSALAVFFITSASAQPPALSPYQTDAQFTSNQDASAEALNIVSVVACYVRSMAPEKAFPLLGSRTYVALIDVNLCEDDKDTSSDQGASQVKQYDTAVVQATLNDSGVLSAKAWMVGFEGIDEFRTWVSAKISGGPNKFPPYGQWEVNWCDNYNEQSKTCESAGFAEVSPDGMKAFFRDSEDGAREKEFSVIGNLSADELSGGGRFFRNIERGQDKQTLTGQYAFGPGFLYNAITDTTTNPPSTTDRCLIPRSDAPGARASAWETWLYNPTTGQRHEVDSGFQIKGADGRWGWAGYWGIYVGNRLVTEGEKLTRVSSIGGSLGEYTATVTKGKLEKTTIRTTNLEAIKGVALKAGASKAIVVNGDTSFVTHSFMWNGSEFVFFGYEVYDPIKQENNYTSLGVNGVQKSLDEVLVHSQNLWARVQGTNTQYTIALQSVASNTVVTQRINSVVVPGQADVPDTLVCMRNCVNSQLDQVQPNGDTSAGDLQTYTWNATNYMMSNTGVAIDFTKPNSPSIYSGPLVEPDDVKELACGSTGDERYCPWLADQKLTTYYNWRSGPSDWERFTGIKDSAGQLVTFDPPMDVTYQVPASDESAGSYAGRTVQMQYAGSGNLWIPGYCFNLVTNERASCNDTTEWANEFTIPFNPATGFVTDSQNNRYLVKTLRRGVFFPETDPTSCVDLKPIADEYAKAALPTIADWQNPADPASANYIGPWQTLNEPPFVIDGELQ